jgi:DNA polymerase-3 subunit epsilon
VIRPPVAIIPAESIRVHGIRPQELADAPELEVVADELIRALEGRTLVAHAKSIELAFLERIYRDRGRRPPRRAIDVLDLAAALADRRDEPQLQSQRLAFVADRFGVPVSRTHHAFDDALVTAQLFLVLATELEGLGMGRLRDLERA